MAINNQDTLNQLHLALEPLNIAITCAKNLNNLIIEPAYLTPYLIIVDACFIEKPNEPFYRAMLKNTSSQTTIVIFGKSDKVSKAYATSLTDGKNLRFIADQGALATLVQELMAELALPESRFYIKRDHALSYTKVLFSSEIVSIHPHLFRLTLPHNLTPFALIAMQCKALFNNHVVWLKLAHLNAENQGTCLLADLTTVQCDRLITLLAQEFPTTWDFPNYAQIKERRSFDLREQFVENRVLAGICFAAILLFAIFFFFQY
jgi:hypothetical protein